MENFNFSTILLSLLFVNFFASCENKSSIEQNLDYVSYGLVDSIIIHSPFDVKFKYREPKSGKLYFVLDDRELISIDKDDKSIIEHDWINKLSPNLNFPILAVAALDDYLVIVTTESFNTVDLQNQRLIFSKKELLTIAPSNNSRIEFLTDTTLLSNVFPYFSMQENQHYGIFNIRTGYETSVILNDSLIGDFDVVDKMLLSNFNSGEGYIYSIVNPSKRLLAGKINDNYEYLFEYKDLNLRFFNDHPFDREFNYDLSDLHHLPQIYDLFIDKENNVFLCFTPRNLMKIS